jgi:radical SAM enzyme (TIGR01210 family)
MPDPLIAARQKLARFLGQSRRSLAPRNAVDEDLLSSFEILPARYHGRVVNRVVLALSSRGCSLFRRPQGGCLHCGLINDGIIKPGADQQELLTHFSYKLSKLDFSRYPVLCIYTPGSFLDNEEIDEDLQIRIISLVAQKSEIRKVILESLPQFITERKINNLKSILDSKELEIAVGLDSQDDQVRNICINKNFSLKMFDRACQLLKKYEIPFNIFALLKPPFLTERESINDTIQTVHYAYKMGAAAVSIEPNTVQENTFTWTLFQKKLYRPPWLWSIIEVIKQLPSELELRIGGIVVYPEAIQSAYNCDKCTATIWQKIQQYNLVQEKNIFNDLHCTCKKQWQEGLKTKGLPLAERIDSILQALNTGDQNTIRNR